MLTLKEQMVKEPLIWTEERRRLCADGTLVIAQDDGALWVRSADEIVIGGKWTADTLADAMVQAEKKVTFSSSARWERAFTSGWELGFVLLQEGKAGWECLIGEGDDAPSICVGRAPSANEAKQCLGFAVAAYRHCLQISPQLPTGCRLHAEGAAGGPHEQWVRGVLAVIATEDFAGDRFGQMKARAS